MAETIHSSSETNTDSAVSPINQEDNLSRLRAISNKLAHGVVYNQRDANFLFEASKTMPSLSYRAFSLLKTPADEASVQKITSVTQALLGNQLPGKELLLHIEGFLQNDRTLSVRETAALSELLIECGRRETPFDQVLDRANKPLYRDDLIKLVTNHNRDSLPKPSLRGTVVTRPFITDDEVYPSRNVEVLYNNQGFLEIRDGNVKPMDISCSQTLSYEQVKNIEALYNEMLKNTYFNNVGLVMEFARFFR